MATKKRFRTKPLKDQVIVITGASSGIGLATARMAAERGARVVLAARNAQDLEAVTNEICGRGGRAAAVQVDVSRAEDVEALGARAVREFGAIDTWVNNAGLSIYGKLTDVPLEDKRRLFDVNFWGVVHGCRTAVRLMKETGGVLINIGSEVSEFAIPLQGIYAASKHAVLGYTDALRLELEHDDVPIAVTLIKPSATNTPFPEHARNYLDEGVPALPPPVYAPEVVARAILHCAERPVRDVVVGGGGRLQIALNHAAPRASDKYKEGVSYKQMKTHDREHVDEGNLEWPQSDGRAWGPHKGHVMRSSVYTSAALSPVLKTMAFAAAGFTLAAGVRRWKSAA